MQLSYIYITSALLETMVWSYLLALPSIFSSAAVSTGEDLIKASTSKYGVRYKSCAAPVAPCLHSDADGSNNPPTAVAQPCFGRVFQNDFACPASPTRQSSIHIRRLNRGGCGCASEDNIGIASMVLETMICYLSCNSLILALRVWSWTP